MFKLPPELREILTKFMESRECIGRLQGNCQVIPGDLKGTPEAISYVTLEFLRCPQRGFLRMLAESSMDFLGNLLEILRESHRKCLDNLIEYEVPGESLENLLGSRGASKGNLFWIVFLFSHAWSRTRRRRGRRPLGLVRVACSVLKCPLANIQRALCFSMDRLPQWFFSRCSILR